MGGRFGAEGHRPILIPTPEISRIAPVTLAACINTTVSLAALGVGAWLVLAGAVGLVTGDLRDSRTIIGDVLYLRFCVALIVVGLFVFFVGAIATARLAV